MFDLSMAQITRLSLHFLDHGDQQPQLHLSEEPVSLTNEPVNDLLHQYIFRPFKNFEDYHSFTYSNGDPTLNPLGILAGQIFNQSEPFHDGTKRIAEHLHQNSNHQGIKSGDLFVALIKDVAYDDEMVDAIGIFKSEQKQDFLKLLHQEDHYNLSAEYGINVNKLDKGCIIFNTAGSNGYVIASIDKTSQSLQAQYWKDDFLNIKPLDDAFHETQQYMNMAQTYVSHRMAEDIDMSRGDQLGILNDAGQFFKSNDTYDENQFEEEVFGGNPKVLESFQRYKKDYAQELQVDMPQQFGISNLAVKRSAKDFKSILKLDKNFHVYIHGDRKMIEHGRDDDGRKYYKLYYESEA